MTTSTQTISKGYKQTEIGMIPTDWDVKSLGDVGEVKMCRRIFNNETKEFDAIPFYKIGTFGKEADAYISQNLYDDYRRRFSFPKKGDVLISAAGTIGRTTVYDSRPAYFQDSNIIWIDNNEKLISNSYLYYVLQIAKYNTEGGTIQRLYNNILNSTKFICPLKPEQSAIAITLSDTDSLIAKLDKLIEKKKNIRQGAMQELLTGKRRLSGFSGKWEMKTFGQVLKIRHGKSQRDVAVINGKYPILASGGEIGRSNEYLYNKPSVLIGRKGTIDIPQYMDEPFWTVDTLFYTEVKKDNVAKFIFYKFQLVDWYLYNEASGVPSLNARTIERIETHFPPDELEQVAITSVLFDMDTEIEKLESQLTKYQDLKQGMIQTLLTGKIRLLTK